MSRPVGFLLHYDDFLASKFDCEKGADAVK